MVAPCCSTKERSGGSSSVGTDCSGVSSAQKVGAILLRPTFNVGAKVHVRSSFTVVKLHTTCGATTSIVGTL